MYNGDLEMPVTFSKRDSAFGGDAAVGRRSDDLLAELGGVAKAIRMPMPPKGPVKKAPTLARAGPQPPKGSLVPLAPGIESGAVTKRLSEVAGLFSKADPVHAWNGGTPPIGKCGAKIGAFSKTSGAVTCKRCAKLISHVAKADRSVDPEDRRQRRLGALSAAAGIGGGTQIRRGVKEIRADTKALGDMPHDMVMPRNASTRAKHKFEQQDTAVQRVRGALRGGHGVLVRRAPGLRTAGGSALVAGAAGLMADHHKRRWK